MQVSQEIRIDYDHDDFVTQPYVIMINGREFMRFNTYARAENALAWHTKNNSLPTWEPIEEIPTASIEFSHSVSDEKDIYVYRVEDLMIGYLQLDMDSALWFNGDGRRYDEWRDAGVALLKAINRDVVTKVYAEIVSHT